MGGKCAPVCVSVCAMCICGVCVWYVYVVYVVCVVCMWCVCGVCVCGVWCVCVVCMWYVCMWGVGCKCCVCGILGQVLTVPTVRTVGGLQSVGLGHQEELGQLSRLIRLVAEVGDCPVALIHPQGAPAPL